MSEIRGQNPRAVDDPSPGVFKIRLVKGGPWVAARIAHDRGLWMATIDGKDLAPHHDHVLAEKVLSIWSYGHVIDQAEYDYMLSRSEYYKSNNPDHPFANPDRKINVSDLDFIF